MKAGIVRIDEQQEYFFEEGCHILELSNSDQDQNLSVARARVEPNRMTKRHLLKSSEERYVILQGSGLAEIGDQEGQPVSVGDVVIIPPGCSQKISNIGETDLLFLAICTPRFVRSDYVDLEASMDKR